MQSLSLVLIVPQLTSLSPSLPPCLLPCLPPTPQDFASDNNYFLTTFASAWTKLMVADRFMGPTGNQCGEKGLTGIVHTVSMNPVVMG